jgi:hypothetical protein
MNRCEKPRSRAEFVDQLRFEAVRLSPEVVVEIISEVEDHLDANIQARMELGESEILATQNAIDDMRSPKAFLRRMEVVYKPRSHSDITILVAGMGILLYLILAAFVPDQLSRSWVTNSVLLFASVVIAIQSFKFGTIQTRFLVSLTLGACVSAMVLSCLLIDTHGYGGEVMYRLTDAQHILSETKNGAPALYMKPFEMNALEKALNAPHLERFYKSISLMALLNGFLFCVVGLVHVIPAVFGNLYKKLGPKPTNLGGQIMR